MEYKFVNVTKSVAVPVPKGMTPEDEATFIAGRIAFVNFEELETKAREAMRLLGEGKLTPFEDVLDELDQEGSQENGKAHESR